MNSEKINIDKVIYWSLVSIITVIGIINILLISVEVWLPVIAFVCLALLLFLIFYYIKSPEKLIFIGLMLNYIPQGLKIGYAVIIVSFLIIVFRDYLYTRKTFKIDIVKSVWIIIIIMGLVTVPKWNLIWWGIQFFAALSIIPLILYILIVDEYITKEGVGWLLSTGIPIIIGLVAFETAFAIIMVLLKQENIFSLYVFRSVEIPGNGSNRLAGMLVFYSVFGYLSKDLWSNGWIKTTLIGTTLILSFALSFLFLSKGAFVTLIIAAMVYLVFKYLVDKKINVTSLIVTVSILIVTLKPFIDQLILRLHNVKTDWSTLSRLVLWRDCISQIQKGILIGTGPGQYSFRVFNEVLVDPHNMFLRYGVEYGGISMALVLIILVYPFIVFIKKLNISRVKTLQQMLIYAPPLIGTVIHSQIDSTITSRTSGPVIWLIWAIFVKKLDGIIGSKEPAIHK